MKKITVDEKFFGGLIQHYMDEQHIQLNLDKYDSDDVNAVGELITGFFQYAGKTMRNNKSESEELTLEVPGYMAFTVSFREGAKEDNWGIGATIDEELKKYIKQAAQDDEDETDELGE